MIDHFACSTLLGTLDITQRWANVVDRQRAKFVLIRCEVLSYC